MTSDAFRDHIITYEKHCIGLTSEIIDYLKIYMLEKEVSHVNHLINLLSANQYLRGYTTGFMDLNNDINIKKDV